jgi:hypothetical protein
MDMKAVPIVLLELQQVLQEILLSSYFVEDASYLRIQNMQLLCTLIKYIEKVGITKIRLYAGVNNLYTFTNVSIQVSLTEPQLRWNRLWFYPIPRTYLLGLNINFNWFLKKYLFIILIVTTIFSTVAVSCSDDFVDRPIEYSIDSENYFNSNQIMTML